MKHSFLTSLITALTTATACAQGISVSVPRLVVGITIDQLRSDYLDAFSPLYGEDGLKRLMREGVVYGNAQYASDGIDRASSAASIYTGTVPFNHGIVGEDWMERQTLRPIHCVDDYAIRGVNTQETASPQHLMVTTLGDELKVATNGRAIVLSVAPYREVAVLSAGHAADWVLWLDDHTGAWAGSTFYGQAPSWTKFLDSKSIADAGNRVWRPSNSAVGAYNYYLASSQSSSFSHRFTGDRRFRSFKQSGLVNATITQTASFVINQSGMGNDDVTDLLSLNYYAGTYDGRAVDACATELQDTYVRLDRAIAELLNEVDKTVGLQNTLFFVTSSGYEQAEQSDYSKYRIPSGQLQINRCAALLNLYLSAIYGQGQYVESYYGNQLYLNHKLIEQKQLNLSKVLETCEDFLYQYSGVRDVYTSVRLMQGAWTPGISRIRNGYNPKCSGDILLQVNPGWTLVNEDVADRSYVRDSYFEFPIIFFGFSLKAAHQQTPVTVDCIAPTLAHFMRIRAPNACATAPLNELN